MKNTHTHHKILLATSIAVLCSHHAQASVTPDAGQITQQLTQPTSLPKMDTFSITMPALAGEIPSGGAQVMLSKVVLSGNSVFTEEQLLASLGQSINKRYDLAGLKSVANQISLYYRSHGYPFARAYLPAQEVDQGVLHIDILEGRYGKIEMEGAEALLSQQAKVFFSDLITGAVIESSNLERTTLILSDQVGIKSSPVIQPGSETGTGDLIIKIKRDKPYIASIGMDNYGNRYTGENKLKANLNVNSPFMLGDQINISGQLSEEKMWFGNLGYNLPLNGDGLRGNVSYAHTYYQLGKDFKALGAKGTADIISAGVSYAVVRSQKTNLNLSANLQHKTLNDDPSKATDSNSKNSYSIPLAVTFDTRDFLLGGGITFGAITWTKGELDLDNALASTDNNHTQGAFDKLTLDLARMQALPDRFSLYIRGSAQWSNKNLDSSEGFGIGGITGVRAYPTGEGYGNVGWVAQTELRYSLDSNFAPYAFYDMGSSTANQTTIQSNTIRRLSGVGLGLRYTQDNWSADISGAWRMTGGEPNDKNIDDAKPRLWGSVSYQF